MKKVLYVLGMVLGLFLLALVVQIVASETGEVVVLTSPAGQSGREERETRLWVVELDGVQYLRARPEAGWYQRLLVQPDLALQRAGRTGRYRAETRMEKAGELNRLMREKYGWRDRYIAMLMGGRDDAVPVALIPSG